MRMVMVSIGVGYGFEVYRLDMILMNPLGLGVTLLIDRRCNISL